MRCTAVVREKSRQNLLKVFFQRANNLGEDALFPLFFSHENRRPGFDKTVAASASILISLVAAAIVYEPRGHFSFSLSSSALCEAAHGGYLSPLSARCLVPRR